MNERNDLAVLAPTAGPDHVEEWTEPIPVPSRGGDGGGGGTRGGRGMGRRADGVRGAGRAASYLVGLLATREDYRARWLRSMRRRSRRAVHQGAVAQVIAEYLWDSGQAPETEIDLPRRLKDTVSRALTGQVLAPVTLGWFVDAFAMTPTDAARLWALWSTDDRDRQPVRGGGPATALRTVALHEFHQVGLDGLADDHRTVHVIRALQPVRRFPYRLAAEVSAVEVLRGGSAAVRAEGAQVVDIVLNRQLAPGETASLEYRTEFVPWATAGRFRRVVAHRVDNMEVNVRFHPDRLPRQVRWAVWPQDLDRPDQPATDLSRPGGPWPDGPSPVDPDLLGGQDLLGEQEALDEEEVPLEPDGSVHRYLDTVAGQVVGFRWDFV